MEESAVPCPLPFVKMHGIGNDMLILQAPSFSLTPFLIRQLADRRRGVGCDQVLVLSDTTPPVVSIWNADGTKAQACGNGTRCLVGFLTERDQLALGENVRFEMPSGLVEGWTTGRQEAAVVQGKASLLCPEKIDLSDWSLPSGFAVDMGNPHLVIPVCDLQKIEIATLGPLLERHPFFSEGTNVEFAQVNEGGISVRVWERGAGQTLACGTGACAVVFALHQAAYVKAGEIPVDLEGGRLWVTYVPGKPLVQRGPFRFVCQGTAYVEPSSPSRPHKGS